MVFTIGNPITVGLFHCNPHFFYSVEIPQLLPAGDSGFRISQATKQLRDLQPRLMMYPKFLTHFAMENGSFIDDLPVKNGELFSITSCCLVALKVNISCSFSSFSSFFDRILISLLLMSGSTGSGFWEFNPQGSFSEGSLSLDFSTSWNEMSQRKCGDWKKRSSFQDRTIRMTSDIYAIIYFHVSCMYII